MLGTDQNHLINPRHCTASARPRARVGRARSAVAGELPLSGIVHARAPKTLLKCVGVPKPAAKFAPTCRTSRGLEIRLRLPPHRLKGRLIACEDRGGRARRYWTGEDRN